MSPVVHVVGAGLAGLAAAHRLAATGATVRLYEAAAQAGGRCRSLADPQLGRTVDNGNHLMLSGNRALARYLGELGAADRVVELAPARLPFCDLATGQRWTVRLAPRPAAGAPFSAWRAGAGALPLLWAGKHSSCRQALRWTGAAYGRFWAPLARAALNTPPETGSARLLRRALAETAGRGEAACRPWLARTGLSDALVDPALAALAERGAAPAYHRRLRRLETADGRATALVFADGERVSAHRDQVVLALPATPARRLVPGLSVPQGHHAIANLHFRLAEAPAQAPPLLGVVGGLAEWVFVRGDVASVTIGAADGLMAASESSLLDRAWPELRRALELPAESPRPPGRAIKERRATLAQTPAALAQRPGPDGTGLANLALAGDWTATGVPASIEGAIRSGERAASQVLARG